MRLPLLVLLAATLSASADAVAKSCEGIWRDPARGRDIPVELRLPDAPPPGSTPLILYSHGLGGSKAGGALWKGDWEKAGFAVLSVQHPGSDEALWRNGGPSALRSGATPEQLRERIADIRFALDQVEHRASVAGCPTVAIDAERIGVAGHSFGAITALVAAGERFRGRSFADPRIKAAIAFSPSPPRVGSTADAFGEMRLPVFLITGTADTVPMFGQDDASERIRPFAAMPPGGKYLLVLDGATHMDLGGGSIGPRARGAIDFRAAHLVAEATKAFWKATLLRDGAMARYLAAPSGFQAEVARGDRFELK